MLALRRNRDILAVRAYFLRPRWRSIVISVSVCVFVCLPVRESISGAKCTCQVPDLQDISRQSYDYLMIMPKLRSTYDRRLIHRTSYEGLKAFLGYNSLAKS